MLADPRTVIPRRDLEDFRDHALVLADEARRQLRAFWNGAIEVKRKPDGSYVTNADLQIERQLRALVERAFPEHGIVGEEFGVHRPQAEFQWIFDPVDGTEDFVQRIPTFGSIIALYYRGQPIVGVLDIPILETRVHAGFGLGAFRNDERLLLADLDPATTAGAVRIMLSARANFVRYRDDGALFDAITRSYPNHRIYRSCYAHVCAVTGQADATIDFGNPIWDIAAARILVEEAGGAYRLMQDYETPQGRIYSSVFGRPSVVEKLSALLR